MTVKKALLFVLLCAVAFLAVQVTLQAQSLQSVRTILNDVWDNANNRLMTTPGVGAQGVFETEVTIFNDVWDAQSHMLRVSGSGGGGGAPVEAEYVTSTTNTTLTAERVLTDTATIVWDRATAGQIKADAVLPASAPTDAQYITSATNGTLSAERVLTNTATVTWDFATPGEAKATAVTTLTGSVVKSKIWLPTGSCQNTTASLLWDLPTTNAPVAVCVTGTNVQKGVAEFANSANLSMQQTLHLPSDWNAAAGVDVKIKWTSTQVDTQTVVWQVEIACTSDPDTDDPAFITAAAIVDQAQTTAPASRTNDASATGITMTGCDPGDLWHVRLRRDTGHASDTHNNAIRAIGVELTIGRTL